MTPYQVSAILLKGHTTLLRRFDIFCSLGLLNNEGLINELPETHKPYFDTQMLSRIHRLGYDREDILNMAFNSVSDILIICDHPKLGQAGFHEDEKELIYKTEIIHTRNKVCFHSLMDLNHKRVSENGLTLYGHSNKMFINGHLVVYKGKSCDITTNHMHTRFIHLAKTMYIGYLILALTDRSKWHSELGVR